MQGVKSEAVKIFAYTAAIFSIALSPFAGIFSVNATSNIPNILYKPSLRLSADEYGLFSNNGNLYVGNKNDEFLQEIDLPGNLKNKTILSENGRYVLYSTYQGMKMYDLSQNILLGGFIENYYEVGTNYTVSNKGDVVVIRNFAGMMGSDAVESPFSNTNESMSVANNQIEVYKLINGAIFHLTTYPYVSYFATGRSFSPTSKYLVITEYSYGSPCVGCEYREVVLDLEAMEFDVLHSYSFDINSKQKNFQAWLGYDSVLVSERTSVNSFKLNVFSLRTKSVISSLELELNKPTNNGFVNSYVYNFKVDRKAGETFIYYIAQNDVFQNNRNRTVTEIGKQTSVIQRRFVAGTSKVLYEAKGGIDVSVFNLKLSNSSTPYEMNDVLYFVSANFGSSNFGVREVVYDLSKNEIARNEPSSSSTYLMSFFTKDNQQNSPSASSFGNVR